MKVYIYITSILDFLDNQEEETETTNGTSSRRRRRSVPDGTAKSNMTVPNMEIKSTYPTCGAYDTDTEKWTEGDCYVSLSSYLYPRDHAINVFIIQVDEDSKIGEMSCLCNTMTSNIRTYSGGFKVPKVNAINFSKVFSNFASLLAGNPATFATVIVLLAFWLLLSIWARRKDKKDVEKVSFSRQRSFY